MEPHSNGGHRVPILPVIWGPQSPFSRYYTDPSSELLTKVVHSHDTVSKPRDNVIERSNFWVSTFPNGNLGSLYSQDTGFASLSCARLFFCVPQLFFRTRRKKNSLVNDLLLFCFQAPRWWRSDKRVGRLSM